MACILFQCVEDLTYNKHLFVLNLSEMERSARTPFYQSVQVVGSAKIKDLRSGNDWKMAGKLHAETVGRGGLGGGPAVSPTLTDLCSRRLPTSGRSYSVLLNITTNNT